MIVVIYEAFCWDVSQGHMNGALNETLTHSWRLEREREREAGKRERERERERDVTDFLYMPPFIHTNIHTYM